jgi:hypothetical protein
MNNPTHHAEAIAAAKELFLTPEMQEQAIPVISRHMDAALAKAQEEKHQLIKLLLAFPTVRTDVTSPLGQWVKKACDVMQVFEDAARANSGAPGREGT